MTIQTAAQSLSAVAADLVGAPRTPTTSEAVTRTLLDWFAVAIAGSVENLPQTLAGALATGGPASLVGRQGAGDVATCALVNATAAHALELDDIYAPGLVHPSAPVVAAALAVGQTVDASGRRFEDAVIAGVEVAGRVGRALGPTHYRRWHTTGTAGALGSAVAAAHMLGLEPVAMTHAIALAATMAGGLQQTFRGDAAGKPLHAGHASHAGVVSALVARAGVTGAVDALEGESGLAAATGAEADWTICHDRSTDTPIIERLTVKPYPCCGHTFAAVAAAIELHESGIRCDDIDKITVATYRTALDVAGDPAPESVTAARFSLAYTVATALIDGRLDRESFTAARLVDPMRQELSARVAIEVNDCFEGAFPARRGAAVTVTQCDGTRITRVVPDRPGSPENPLSTDAITVKFHELVSPVLGVRGAFRLRDQLLDLWGVASVSRLHTDLRRE